MTFSTYIVFAIVLFLAIQYNKLIDRERMYKDYYHSVILNMNLRSIDPQNILLLMKDEYENEFDEKLAKEAIENAFVHYFRCRGVKIENLKIYWNEST